MISLTKKEREMLLVLFKDFTNFYNANSISKLLKISHVGAQKIFKRLFRENLVVSRAIGKSITYRLNFNEDYTSQLITLLLSDEANGFKRWKEEFNKLFKDDRIVMIFGSAVKNYASAGDIDLMVVIKNKYIDDINNVLKEKEEVLPKKLHTIKLTHKDLLENLRKNDKVMLDIVKNAVVLYGQREYVGVMKNAAGP